MSGYVFTFERKQYSPDGQTNVPDVDAHNKRLEQIELEEWASKPERFNVYAKDQHVTTWLGTTLGHIIRSSTYRNNLGSHITAITVRGNNGAIYHGRYGSDWASFVRLRKSK